MAGVDFSNRLKALNVPPESQGDGLVAYLEDRFIRQLDEAARPPLRQQAHGTLRDYLIELGASSELLAACDSEGASSMRVRAWLVNTALHFDYSDHREQYEAAAPAGSSAPEEQNQLIAADDPELVELCAAMGVTPDGNSAIASLQAVVKAARQRPRPPPPPALPAKRAAPEPAVGGAGGGGCGPDATATATATPRSQPPARSSAPLAGLSDGPFPLGFETGSAPLDEASRVLRMLHVRELRRLQDEVNHAVVKLQEFTANPRTDARLGRVGR